MITTQDKWQNINTLDLNADLADDITVVSCDTRDFAIYCSTEKPTVYKHAECNYEIWHNKGLSKLYSVLKKQNREKYAIDKKDILTWLDSLCKASGGYDKEWRYLEADVDNCKNWNIKYIRFVRSNKNPNEFIVCNAYMMPIEFRKIIDNLGEI